ncbi:hypothetical protein F5Y13DRAFT_167648 [Hypoxylon sp. FL1857]|nr:hypothetical protein F5Y13DRAFT_167648 [Hypoxylon sp. FL1857]
MSDARSVPPKETRPSASLSKPLSNSKCHLLTPTFYLLGLSSPDNPSRESSKNPSSIYTESVEDVPMKPELLSATTQALTHETGSNYTQPRQLSFNQDGVAIAITDFSAVARQAHTKSSERKSWKPGSYYCEGTWKHRNSRASLSGLLAVGTVVGLPLAATALTLSGQELRIGSGMTAVTSAVSLIPLRRDERVSLPVLVSMYLFSLATTVIFLVLQYRNIMRHQGRYIFGTFLLTGHFVVGLSQTSVSTSAL